ncbi:MAG TPA: threonine--tRNA ligase [Pirellulales bacterium]|nr:threonine--tRNA ligase [Pirellulales bacterium]
MLKVKLPDGSVREYSEPVRVIDVAQEIGPRLAKATLAAQVDGRTVGIDFQLPASGEVSLRLLTKKDPEALGVMRHSCAHVMARAVMRLFGGVQLAFGPTTDHGFYYDIGGLDRSLSETDFAAIEAEMAKIVKADEPFERLVEPRAKAVEICQGLEQPLKVEHIETGLADQETLSFYRQGEFLDLCRGPHVPSAGSIGEFKLLSVAGAYWKGDASRQQLQRLYGTAWFSKQELEEYLRMVEEAKRRDHRVLGRQLELFATSPLVGSGLILWLPKGAIVRGLLEAFVRDELFKRGYEPVYTPNIGRVEMYETSGHFPYYRDSQFMPIFGHDAGQVIDYLTRKLDVNDGSTEHDLTAEGETRLIEAARLAGFDADYDLAAPLETKLGVLKNWSRQQERYLLKPMNCPHHIMIYKSKPRSYRDLPVRLAEFGTVYRYEQSGELGGMTRVRGFTQDDAHLFCTEEQVADEFRGCLEMTQHVLTVLGLTNYRVRLGFRDPDSDKYVGSAESWDRAEKALEEVCRSMNLPQMEVEQGEAAFYGPKADFVVADCLGREWQLGTVQLDYNLPSAERFALEYVGADNTPHRPVMIHRAPLGSMERFIGVLIEHFAGAFPLWLAPEQVRVLIVSEKSEQYARGVETQLKEAGFRVTGDYRSEKLGAKIRDAQLKLVPYMFVIGEKDAAGGTVSVRDRIKGDLGAMPVASAVAKLRSEIDAKTIRQAVPPPNVGLAAGGGQENEY